MAIRLSHTEVHTCTHMDNNRALGFIVLVISGCEFVCVCNTIRAVCDTMKTNRLKDRGTHSGGESTSIGINKWDSRKSRAHSLQFSWNWLQAYRIILYWNIDKHFHWCGNINKLSSSSWTFVLAFAPHFYTQNYCTYICEFVSTGSLPTIKATVTQKSLV